MEGVDSGRLDGRGGTWRTGKGAQMDGSIQQCRSVKGEQSVCETDLDVSPLQMKCEGYITWCLLSPQLCLSSLSCRRRTEGKLATGSSRLQNSDCYLLHGLVVYLFEHISCILYIVTSQTVLGMSSSYRAPIGSFPSVTVVFDVWYAVRLGRLQIGDSVQSNTFQGHLLVTALKLSVTLDRHILANPSTYVWP